MPYDAPEGMTLRGPLQPGDEKRLGVDMAGFIRSHHGYEEGWVGRKFLGQGAAGRAGMWEKRDADKNVVDVRKAPPPKSHHDSCMGLRF